MNEKTSGDGSDDGHGLGPDDEPTLVIVPRISRPAISKALRMLAFAFKRLRAICYETASILDEATAMGIESLTEAEVHELDEALDETEARIKGIRGSLKRATGQRPITEP